MVSAFFTGFAVGLSLIVAIGAQNAFVFRQGLLGQHVWPVALFCSVSDALLIVVGVAGLSFLLTDALLDTSKWLFAGAALWLLGYGVLRLRSAINGYSVSSGHAVSGGLMATLSMTAALTFANPHVYLDTVVLIGTISLQFSGMAKLAYAIGATTASFLFFFTLAFGARLLAGPMQRRGAWRLLDGAIGLLMFGLALGMARAGNWL
jgi:L-lysine exporter family protein LysE/ArgO